MTEQIGRIHDFHNAEYAQDWANRFAPTPPRQQLFDLIVNCLLDGPLPYPHIVELGIGPGYLALEVLQRVPKVTKVTKVTYEGVDFSQPMLDIAAKRLHAHRDRLTFTQADLTSDGWGSKISQTPGAIITTWALHDLGSESAIKAVYTAAKQVLPTGGLLLNGDFVKPEATAFEFEAGRITINRHLALLTECGFRDVQCRAYLEPNADAPTPANNYACFTAYV